MFLLDLSVKGEDSAQNLIYKRLGIMPFKWHELFFSH